MMRMDRLKWASRLAPLTLLAACGGADTGAGEAEGGAVGDAPSAVTEASSEPAAGAALQDAATAASAQAPTTGGGDLFAYVGKWPFDKVNEVAWNDNPKVLAGIRKSVTDAAAREAILTLPGPSSDISLTDGKVTVWACQQHNCGDHQWLVQITPDGAATDVCYFNKAKDAEKARWFLASGKVESRVGDCNLE